MVADQARVRTRPLPPVQVPSATSHVMPSVASSVTPSALPRLRVREPVYRPTPTWPTAYWPNGSAVYDGSRRYADGRGGKIGEKKDEETPGFLGRMVRLGERQYSTWKYRPSGYVYLGIFDHSEGLGRLG